jgi:hypothetical protein
MKGYFIKSTKVTPSVYFNPAKGLLDMRGKSSPENPLTFYNHLYSSLDRFGETEHSILSLNVAFEYFNTSSSKCIYGMFKKLECLRKAGKKVNINWYYEDGDEDMMEAGEDLSFMFKFEFNFVEVPEITVLGEKKESVLAA